MKLTNPVVIVGFVAEKCGSDSFAKAAYTLASKLGSAQGDARLGGQAMEKANPADAVLHFKRAALRNPANAQCHFKLGLCLMKLERWAEAQRSIAQAMKLDPSRTSWAVQYKQAKERAATKPKPKKLKADPGSDPSTVTTMLLIEDLAMRHSNFDLLRDVAVTTFGPSAKTMATFQILAAQRYLATGNLEEAARIAARFENGGSSPHGAYIRAMLAFQRRDWNGCIDAVQQWLFTTPSTGPRTACSLGRRGSPRSRKSAGARYAPAGKTCRARHLARGGGPGEHPLGL